MTTHGNASTPAHNSVARVDLSVGSLQTVLVDDVPSVVLKPAIEQLGLDFRTQLRKLRTRSWAVVGETDTTGSDGKTYTMATVPVRTFIMALANINENRVREDLRPVLVAFQLESADALESYWTRGGAINPAASDEQLDDIQQQIEERRIARALGLVKIVAAMDDSVDPRWKRSRQMHHYAVASGTEPDIPEAERALMVEPYLKDLGLSRAEIKTVRSPFGRKVSLAYEMQYGVKPKDSRGEIDGRERNVKSYTEADRPIFDRVWREFYADRYPSQLELIVGGDR